MKIKYYTMIFASLFLTACSNGLQTKEAKRIQTESIDDIDSTRSPVTNHGVRYSVDVKDDANETLDLPSDGELQNESIAENQDSSPSPLSTYSTKVYTKTADRMKNLQIVCDKISGVILEPGEEFSYNKAAGPYDKAHGFGKATVFLSNGDEVNVGYKKESEVITIQEINK